MIHLAGVEKSYSTGEVSTSVLRNVNLDVERGEFVVVLGASGCGKTTMLNLIGGLDAPTSGVVQVEGTDIGRLGRRALIAYRREKLGFVFQFYNLLPTLRARENVEVALEILPLPRDVVQSRASEYLRLVGLEGKEHMFPAQLSGGEQQRVAIARALAKEAGLVLADEPTGNLDSHTGAEVIALMRDLQARMSLTIMLVTHNPEICAVADRVIRIVDGQIASITRGGNREQADRRA